MTETNFYNSPFKVRILIPKQVIGKEAFTSFASREFSAVGKVIFPDYIIFPAALFEFGIDEFGSGV
jgi:hypothetical protein